MPVELFGTLRGQIVAGEELDMDIRLLGVGDVRVRVEGPDNLPVVGASVTLTTAFPTRRRATGSTDGHRWQCYVQACCRRPLCRRGQAFWDATLGIHACVYARESTLNASR